MTVYVCACHRPMRRSGRVSSEPAQRHPVAMLVHLWMWSQISQAGHDAGPFDAPRRVWTAGTASAKL